MQCDGALALRLWGPGAARVLLGYAFAERAGLKYKTLPVRADIASALVEPPVFGPSSWSGGLGMTALRLGGSMSNAAGYRWKNFRGPRELRRPYAGTWYTRAMLKTPLISKRSAALGC